MPRFTELQTESCMRLEAEQANRCGVLGSWAFFFGRGH